MIFLIEYNQARGEIESIEHFPDSQRDAAEAARLELELRLNHQRLVHEVVLLEAPTEDALRVTHRRYFESLEEMSRSANGAQ